MTTEAMAEIMLALDHLSDAGWELARAARPGGRLDPDVLAIERAEAILKRIVREAEAHERAVAEAMEGVAP